jgi:hypothetical protein
LTIKRLLAVLAAVTLIPISWPVYRLGVGFGLWQPVTRPSGVSPRAHYVSGETTAAWFDCSVSRTKNVDVCRAWDDAGHLIAYGDFRLDGEKRAATATELRPSMVQPYPGHPELAWIYLSDRKSDFSKTLVPVNDAGEPLERFEVH